MQSESPFKTYKGRPKSKAVSLLDDVFGYQRRDEVSPTILSLLTDIDKIDEVSYLFRRACRPEY